MTFVTLSTRFITGCFLLVITVNVFYFRKIYNLEEQRLRDLELQHLHSQSFEDYIPDAQIEYPPDSPYQELDPDQKVAFLLHSVQAESNSFHDNSAYHLAEFSPKEVETSELLYDPRVTFSVYLHHLLHGDGNTSVPFAWSDWVDLTVLNQELDKLDSSKLTCSWLQSKVNKPTNHPDFCINKQDLSQEQIDAIGLPFEQLPGFIVTKSPQNKIPNEQSIMQAKGHLLTSAELPIKLVFLTSSGTYQLDVQNDRKDIYRSGMLDNYLQQRGLSDEKKVKFTPRDIMKELTKKVKPKQQDTNNPVYAKAPHGGSREFNLTPEMFHYSQEDVEAQIHEYQEIMKETTRIPRSEAFAKLSFNYEKLSKQELNHYQGLVGANRYSNDDEPVYYKLATLYLDEENQDNGWHYEWRFFNGAFKYMKDKTWTQKQLAAREKIILERLLRNWFKFSKEMGIVSWISHGPLLAWYWNGFMFPFDIDIDIQMPIAELNKLTKNHNMTLVIEDVEDGFGKYLIDCSTYLHHRDISGKGNYIDARFIDVDSGVYIDITALSKNNEIPPPEYNSLIKEKTAKGELVELYMDRRKHWMNFEKLNLLRLTMIDAVPVYVPNDIMSMLNFEYSQGTTAYYFNHYFYVPIIRLWLPEGKIIKIFEQEGKYRDRKGKVNVKKLVGRIKNMDLDDKVRLLESDKEILIEYERTNEFTSMHNYEKLYMMDFSQQLSVLDLHNNTEYHQLTSRYELGRPLMNSLFAFEYYDRAEGSD
ncbi:uncharacterized protein CANTADRAFT_55852 [Suhomyces tanzawaensis NRRL Y-17324]|uniref:LicD/FKTN/FKRP nucleotidyltransferase domain-containing protein n=1 Tax=Suhomyces tanzawaensis NRRL Y-17324 TaxID=984487 RepID=A0A1E4SD07_9ASCO|nr:uncharacterized protein CANTADRAFT_55852 [Suhomyces tanzawaensis NRRL Y-17324]ODV77401.1 hypothetical protein CANTADRAFT_55852 [Suhomyces tanzawaensis NRRL Y-17324]